MPDVSIWKLSGDPGRTLRPGSTRVPHIPATLAGRPAGGRGAAKIVPCSRDAEEGPYLVVTAAADPGTSMPISLSISFTESGMLAWPAIRFISAPR